MALATERGHDGRPHLAARRSRQRLRRAGRSTTHARSLADRPGQGCADVRRRLAARRDDRGIARPTDGHRRRLATRDSEYSFDGDWGNRAELGAVHVRLSSIERSRAQRDAQPRGAPRVGRDARRRERSRGSSGVYALDVDEHLDEISSRRVHRSVHAGILRLPPTITCGATTTRATSRCSVRSTARSASAGAGRSGCAASSAMRGLSRQRRAGRRAARYDADRTRPMWGGQATVHFDPRERLRSFATLSRGYKAGGFNLGQAASCCAALRAGVPVEPRCRRQGRVARSAPVRRRHCLLHEARATCRSPPACSSIRSAIPNSYVFLTDNASGGRNLGIESSVRWRADPSSWRSAARSGCCARATTAIVRQART